MTLAAEGEEVLRTAQTRAIQDSSTLADRARQDTAPCQLSHEIRRREGHQRGPGR